MTFYEHCCQTGEKLNPRWASANIELFRLPNGDLVAFHQGDYSLYCGVDNAL